MNVGLNDKGVLVTGAAGGIGQACAQAFAAEGARVVCSDVDSIGVQQIAGRIGAEALPADVTSAEDVRRLVGATLKRTGALDVVVAGHGVFHATAPAEITADEWDRVQAVNLRGTFLLCQAALEQMIPSGHGSIVAIASLAGQVGGMQAGASYAASKAGVAALTKSLARYAGPHGVRVNCVNPGFIDTTMTAGYTPGERAAVVERTPLGRMGTVEEVADAVVWLASERAAFVHGTHLDVNGGLYMN